MTPLTARSRFVNPRLGVYFGIFMSAFCALGLLALIFEGLEAPPYLLSASMLLGPVALYAAIGLASFTREPIDYFAAGRRVPAFYSGLVLAQTAMGATGLVALGGAFFLIGFDALCLGIGGLAGFVVMAIMLAPFLRKFGAFTLASYLGRRFQSRTLRVLAAAVLSVPTVLMLAAEFRMGAYAASYLYAPASPALLIGFLAVVLAVTLAAGGMRSLTWSTAAESIASLIALLVPVGIVAVIVTNLPLPQLSHGPVLRMLGRAESAMGLPIIIPPALAFDLPGEGLGAITKRFADALGSVGSLAFPLATLSTMAGVAAAPWLLPRVAATPGVYEARKSLGWATLLFGITMLTLASMAVFMRDYLTDIVRAPGPVRIPDWLSALRAAGVADFDAEATRLTLGALSFKRDAILFALPSAAGLPEAVLSLAAAGIVAAALAAAGACAVALGNMLAEDVVFGLSWTSAPPPLRLAVARGGLGAALAMGVAIAVLAPTDPLKLMLWAFALTASAGFPVLILSIWWKRLNVFGVIAGMVTGFAVAVLAILSGEAGWISLDSMLSAVLGAPAGLAAAISVTLLTPAPTRQLLELVRDIRVPGGEILYDREMRLERRTRRLSD